MMQSLMVMSQAQEKALPMGLVSADNVYNLTKKLANAAGFRNAEEFFTPPKPNPQTGVAELPPPPPNPMVQVKQMELQGDAQKTQAVHAHESSRWRRWRPCSSSASWRWMPRSSKRSRRAHWRCSNPTTSGKSQLDQQKFQLDMRAQDMARDEAIQLANIKAASAAQVARINHGLDEQYELQRQQEKEAGYQIMQNEIAAAKDEMAQRMAAPKRVLRDATGRVAGVEHAGVVHAVVRDANGKIVGTASRRRCNDGSGGNDGDSPRRSRLSPTTSRQARYRKVWERAEYREVAPGEHCAMEFLTRAQPEPDATVIDFGCGTGRGGMTLAKAGLPGDAGGFCRQLPGRRSGADVPGAAGAHHVPRCRPDQDAADERGVWVLHRRAGAHPNRGRADGAAEHPGKCAKRLFQHRAVG